MTTSEFQNTCPDSGPTCVSALEAMYASRGAAAVDALAPVLSDDFTFVPAGSASELQDTYLGAEGFLEFLRRQAAWTDDTWWPVLEELLVGERWIVAIVSVDPVRADGLGAHFEIVHRWQRRGELICGFRSFVDRQDDYDAFHTSAS